jgi:hypothetical protein
MQTIASYIYAFFVTILSVMFIFYGKATNILSFIFIFTFLTFAFITVKAVLP